MRRTPLSKKGKGESTVLKDQIQDKLRELVIKRDGTCILRKALHCNDPVLQADHLITRANSATYADSRLVVCLCRSCHGWKHWHKEQYDDLVKTTVLPKKIVKLWNDCERDSWKPRRTGSYDWRVALAVLEQEIKQLD